MKFIPAFFHRFFAFAQLHQDVADELAKLCHRKQYQPGDIIFDQGDEVSVFYWISEGEVALRLAGKCLKTLHDNQLMAEDAVFDAASCHDYSAVALTDVELIQVDGPGFMHLVQQHPALGLQLLKAVSVQCHQVPEEKEKEKEKEDDNIRFDPLAFLPQYFKPAEHLNPSKGNSSEPFEFFQE